MNWKTYARHVLYQKFISDKEYSVKEVAAGLGKNTGFIYDIWEKRKDVTWEDIREIAMETGDNEIFNIFLVNTNKQTCNDFDPAKHYSPDDFKDEVSDNLESLGDLSRTLKQALKDNTIDDQELEKLEDKAKKNVKEAQEILYLVRKSMI